ncbi:MAG: helix-turn-helix transcriptional regulator [Nitrospirae bacterium]|nr:helix-turn-helix transcriptional regulator [Nitrospirota bacterium]
MLKIKPYKLGTAIYSIRLHEGKTQQELAIAAGVGQDYISLIERDKRVPSIEILKKILVSLNVMSLAEFFRFAEMIDNTKQGKLLDLLKRLLEKGNDLFDGLFPDTKKNIA